MTGAAPGSLPLGAGALPLAETDPAHLPTIASPSASVLEVAIITGLSGAGRSTAAKCLEDLGWFVVDNLPPGLLATMADLGSRSQGAVERIAAVLPNAEQRTLAGQPHDIAPEVLVPVLAEYLAAPR